MPEFGCHLVRPVLLPNDAKRGSVDAETDVVGLTANGYLGNCRFGEAVMATAFFSSQRLRDLIENDNDRSAFGAGLRLGVGEDAIELLWRGPSVGDPRRGCQQRADDHRRHPA